MIDKKEIVKQYKQTVQPMGIFQIWNLANGKIYLASSKNLRGMANRFEFGLDIGSHISKESREDYLRPVLDYNAQLGQKGRSTVLKPSR